LNYHQAISYLYGLIDYEKSPRFPYSQVKLKRSRELFKRLGNPEKQLKIISVAGTKGKGSTSAILSSILQHAGFKVGLYTSPHLVDFRERIRVNFTWIPPEALAELTTNLKPVIEGMREHYPFGSPTYFEVSVAMAYLYFLSQGVDFAVMEVGLGGRLDATNTGKPVLSIITPISYDHMEILGDTLEKIAGEKAGIIKRGSPLILAPQLPESLKKLNRIISAKQVSTIRVGEDTGWKLIESGLRGSRFDFYGIKKQYRDLSLPLMGAHQLVNTATALSAIEQLEERGYQIFESAIKAGVAQVAWPGRNELFDSLPRVLLDVAHNLASARALGEVIRQIVPRHKAVLVFGILKEKDIRGVLSELLPLCSRVYFTTPNNPRAENSEVLLEISREFLVEGQIAASPLEALKAAMKAAAPGELVVIAGSFYLAGELRPLIEKLAAQNKLQEGIN